MLPSLLCIIHQDHVIQICMEYTQVITITGKYVHLYLYYQKMDIDVNRKIGRRWRKWSHLASRGNVLVVRSACCRPWRRYIPHPHSEAATTSSWGNIGNVAATDDCSLGKDWGWKDGVVDLVQRSCRLRGCRDRRHR